jgi:predicted phosphodiesterase
VKQFALISDIHANLPALRAVLDDVEQRGVDTSYHLGDLTGYAPWPNEVVSLLREKGIAGISGNYDSTVATDYKHCGCRAETARDEELSHISYEWTRSTVTPEIKRYLGGLPFRLDIRPFGGHVSGPTIFLVHGNQSLNTVYVTEDRTDAFLEKMAQDIGAGSGDAICFGHTHKPWQRKLGGIRFVNTGSVGRPKDGDSRACYALVSVAEARTRVEFIRVAYDVESAALAVRDAGLPSEFAAILRSGG